MPNKTLTGTYPAGYALTSPGYTLINLGSVGGGGLQVQGAGDSVINQGQIGGTIVGVYLTATPGLVITNQLGATISGASYGIDSAGTPTVVNAGSIAGGASYHNAGVYLKAAGLVINEAGGTIGGYYGIGTGFGYPSGTLFAYISPPITVVNDGAITGSTTHSLFQSGAGILVSAGGTVVNHSGGIISGAVAIENKGTPGLAVINAGSIVGESADYHGYGVALRVAGGSVTNQAGGFISGFTGVQIYSASGPANVVNSGTIDGSTTTFGAGISLSSGGSVSNNGTIAGPVGINISGGRGTVTNYGLIEGTTDAVKLGANANDRLIVGPGAQFSGIVDGGNTIGPSPTYVSTLELASSASAGTLSGLGTQFINFGSIAFDAGASWFIAGSTAGLAGTIAGFAAHDTIEVSGITVTGSSFSGGVLTLDEASGSATLAFAGTFTTGDFVVSNVAGGADVTLACFREGTCIRTTRGDVAVERLRVGEMVATLHPAGSQPIAWIGHRRVDCRRHPRPQQVWPVRIAAGAFGMGAPHRDLFLSADHAVFVDGVLIPIRLLVNGSTIAQVPADEVTYWHIELPRHAVLLADGLAAESYLDTNARGDFAGAAAVTLHPDFAVRRWEAHGCAPLVLAGPILAAVRRRFAACAMIADVA